MKFDEHTNMAAGQDKIMLMNHQHFHASEVFHSSDDKQ